MNPEAHAKDYTARVAELMGRMPHAAIGEAITVLDRARATGATVYLVGNGGSAATASHMANDLMKTVAKQGQPGFKAVALTDNVATMTAIANDEGYDRMFTGQLELLGRPGDALVAITGSGNSPNVVAAVELARQLGMSSIGILGMTGGRVLDLVDVAVLVPSDDYGPIEDAHVIVDHLITEWFQRRYEPTT